MGPSADTESQEEFDGYRDARRAAAVERRPGGGLVRISGRDAVSFLQGVLTNDVAALLPGQSCYAAYLTAQGRMLSDMHVLRRHDDVLVVLEAGVAAAVASRFDQSIFTEDVHVEDLSAGVSDVGIHGPSSHAALAAAIEPGGEVVAAALATGGHARASGTGGDLVVFAGRWLGVPGARVLGPPQDVDAIARRLATAGVPLLAPGALEARRIEAGTPVFGVDMTTDTIPLEAGIEARAISTTKGCYVGQEIIVRILHRAHGRVARRLVGLVANGAVPPPRGAVVRADEREVGAVTSAAWSPDLSAPIGLAMVHRDASEPGTVVTIGDAPTETATVRALPLLVM